MPGLNPLQNKLLEMLQWFHGFCTEHNIRYYAIGGTMLGAVRHHGFIPWDDDIDVGLPREDYERLISMRGFLKENMSRYRIETMYDDNPEFVYPFAKLYDTSTTMIEDRKNSVKRGIYIDLFPLDGIADTKEQAKKEYRGIKLLLDLEIAQTATVREGRTFYKNLAVRAMRLLPKCFFKPQKMLKKIDELCKRKNFNTCVFVGNLVGSARYKEIMARNYFGTPTKYKFEHIEIYGVEKPDEYLTSIYGNWRQLPPSEKQKSHHTNLYIDLNKSYLEV